MTSEQVDFPRQLAFQYLEQIELLADAVKTGMSAVGANALPAFEKSVARQQEICAGLCRLAGQLNLEQPAAAKDGGSLRPLSAADRSLARRIQLAGASLLQLNAEYAALLRHSGESVRLFAGLCRSYTAHFQPPVVAGQPRTAWSCKF